MIYLFMALYAEAKPIIKELGLKKKNPNFYFWQYESGGEQQDRICLTITGMGSIAASTAVGAVCACEGIKDSDFILNIGTSASLDGRIKDVFMLHKITEQMTGKTFYPDILYRHPFREAEAVSVPVVIKGGMEMEKRRMSCGIYGKETGEKQSWETKMPVLWDMEAAAIYQAGNYFVGPQQMQFVKVISDAGNSAFVTADDVTECVECHGAKLAEYIGKIANISKSLYQDTWIFSTKEEEWIRQVCEDLHCSVTMQARVRQMCKYWKLSGADYVTDILKWYADGLLPCRDKKEGKKRIDEFAGKLL